MSLVAVAGAKGAAGVTTTSTALAAVWPTPAILADCDPCGGDLVLRLRSEDGGWLANDRGVVGLAAAARTQPARLDVDGQLQKAAGGLPVLVGVDSPAQAARIGGLWPAIADALAQVAGTDVIADCGRLLPGLPSGHVMSAADLLVLVVRPSLESIAHLRHALPAVIGDGAGRARLLHVAVLADPGRADRDVAQVREALSMALPPGSGFAAVAYDPAAAAGLAGTPTRGLDRSALVTSARTLAAELYRSVHSVGGGAGETADVPQAPSTPVEVG